MTDTDLSLNDVHEFTERAPDSVQFTASAARRLVRLSARAELAQETYQREQAALIEAINGIFEDAGVQYTPQDRFQIDWRTNTLYLRRGE